ncbi:hypothetical protein EDB89DRAFT_773540 [Lactarius sanguifluus]|nr:hypothetical protein EDB89DRAFT_773540 [Lactarius sanguifluus]
MSYPFGPRSRLRAKWRGKVRVRARRLPPPPPPPPFCLPPHPFTRRGRTREAHLFTRAAAPVYANGGTTREPPPLFAACSRWSGAPSRPGLCAGATRERTGSEWEGKGGVQTGCTHERGGCAPPFARNGGPGRCINRAGGALCEWEGPQTVARKWYTGGGTRERGWGAHSPSRGMEGRGGACEREAVRARKPAPLRPGFCAQAMRAGTVWNGVHTVST